MDTNLSTAQIKGRALAEEILAQRPPENFTNTGVFKIRDADGKKFAIPIRYEVIATATNWQSIYETIGTDRAGHTNGVCLKIIHANDQPNRYAWRNYYDTLKIASGMGEYKWSGTQWTHPLPGDFLAVDFGLEFFHWPEQQLLKRDMKRGRSCKVLESTNPSPTTNGYARVVSWIDNESLGIVQAEAFDVNNILLKEFEPKNFKKVNGQWQLQEMEIRNVQTGSRTRIEFNLGGE